MNKKISTTLIGIAITALAINMAQAASFAKVKNKVDGKLDICSALTYYGHGSQFASADAGMDALLYYEEEAGDGVSGGFGAIVDGKHISAPISDSHCNNGFVDLKWQKSGFVGQITGEIDIEGNRITNVNGTINGKQVQDDLLFKGYK